MTDSLGNELKIGDNVAFVSCNYKNCFKFIDTGFIEKLCPYMCRIRGTKKMYWRSIYSNIPNNVVYRAYDRIIKI